jgi:hypothetical protein
MLKEIAEHNNVNLIEVQPGDQYCKANGEDAYIDHSYVAGKDIELGIYADPEKKIISFFHEMGHILTPNRVHKRCNTKYEIEKKAWKYGFKLAKFYGIEFNKDTKEWANAQLESYRGWEEREMI